MKATGTMMHAPSITTACTASVTLAARNPPRKQYSTITPAPSSTASATPSPNASDSAVPAAWNCAAV